MIERADIHDHSRAAEVHDRSSGTAPDFGMAATRTDVLSQVLTLIRLRGELVYSAMLGAPWSIAYAKGAAHFHFVERGTLWLRTPGAEAIRVQAGDMLLLPHGTGISAPAGSSGA